MAKEKGKPPRQKPNSTKRSSIVQRVWGQLKKRRLPIGAGIGLALSAAAVYFTYTLTGADDLRVKVYQPLFQEVSAAEQAVRGAGLESFSASVFNNLSQTGDLQRVPGPLRDRITRIYGEISSLASDVNTTMDLVQRNVSQRLLMGIRTQVQDREWIATISRQLRQESLAQPGIAVMANLQLRHTGRSRAIDMRDRNRPIISGPGGPTWNINDWATYPKSLPEIEKLWTDEDFLYFDPVTDEWYYRITRSDLQRSGITLEAFVEPVHEALMKIPAFKHFVEGQAKVADDAKILRAELADRIRRPKQLSDLFR